MTTNKNNHWISDLIAGLTTAIADMPDAMASAVLAGTNPIYGLYAIMVGKPVGALLTSSQFMTLGVTSAMALTAGSALAGIGPMPIRRQSTAATPRETMRARTRRPCSLAKSSPQTSRPAAPIEIGLDVAAVTVPFWSMPENTDHPTQKPEKLLAKLILASSTPGDMVFDPFLGSDVVEENKRSCKVSTAIVQGRDQQLIVALDHQRFDVGFTGGDLCTIHPVRQRTARGYSVLCLRLCEPYVLQKLLPVRQGLSDRQPRRLFCIEMRHRLGGRIHLYDLALPVQDDHTIAYAGKHRV